MTLSSLPYFILVRLQCAFTPNSQYRFFLIRRLPSGCWSPHCLWVWKARKAWEFTHSLPLKDRWVWRYWSSSFLASICIALRRDLYYPHKSSARWHRSSLLWDLAWYHTCPLSPTSLLPYYWFVLEILPNTTFSYNSSSQTLLLESHHWSIFCTCNLKHPNRYNPARWRSHSKFAQR